MTLIWNYLNGFPKSLKAHGRQQNKLETGAKADETLTWKPELITEYRTWCIRSQPEQIAHLARCSFAEYLKHGTDSSTELKPCLGTDFETSQMPSGTKRYNTAEF